MKLLITGGCGFLGSNLSQYAIRNKADLIIFDNLSRQGSRDNLSWLKKQGRTIFEFGDIRIKNDIESVIKKYRPDAIFHLAGQVAMTTSIKNPELDFQTNVVGTLNLLESVRQHGPDIPILYSSTNKVYGDLEQYKYEESTTRYKCIDRPIGFDEQTQLDFQSPYGCSKGAADQYMLDYARIYGLKTIVFRHSSMYGGRQFATYDQGWIGWFCLMAAMSKKDPNQNEFTISGNGKQVRDVLHSDDMIELYYSALRNIERIKGNAFNIGGGLENSFSLKELISHLENDIGHKLNYQEITKRESDQRVFIADTGKINKMIGWAPQVNSKEGVSKMLNWVLETIS